MPFRPRALSLCFRVGQGVFMYWIPSSAFQMGQTFAMKNNAVREFIGLQPIGVPPRGAAGAAPPAKGEAKAIDDSSSPEGQKSLTAGVLPRDKMSEA